MTHYSTPKQVPSWVFSAPVTFPSFLLGHHSALICCIPHPTSHFPTSETMSSQVPLRTRLPTLPAGSNSNLALVGVGFSSSSTSSLCLLLLYHISIHHLPPALKLPAFTTTALLVWLEFHYFGVSSFYLSRLANLNPPPMHLIPERPSHISSLHCTLSALSDPFILRQKPLSSSPRFLGETCFMFLNPSPPPSSRPADNLPSASMSERKKLLP